MKTYVLFLSFLFLEFIFGCTSQSQPDTTSVPFQVNQTVNISSGDVQATGNVTANGSMNVTVVVTGDLQVTTDCGNPDCFNEKFVECEPATVTSALTPAIVYYYEILGPEGDYCRVRSKFTNNPNPAWIGKEMVCQYDNSKDFEIAVRDMSRCEGELYTLMTGG